jgi:hypothetical protein
VSSAFKLGLQLLRMNLVSSLPHLKTECEEEFCLCDVDRDEKSFCSMCSDYLAITQWEPTWCRITYCLQSIWSLVKQRCKHLSEEECIDLLIERLVHVITHEYLHAALSRIEEYAWLIDDSALFGYVSKDELLVFALTGDFVELENVNVEEEYMSGKTLWFFRRVYFLTQRHF